MEKVVCVGVKQSNAYSEVSENHTGMCILGDIISLSVEYTVICDFKRDSNESSAVKTAGTFSCAAICLCIWSASIALLAVDCLNAHNTVFDWILA